MAGVNASPSGFSAAVLQVLGIQPTDLAVQALNAMQQGEGQWGASGSWNAASDYNPFNISGGQPVISQYGLDASIRGTQDPGNGPPVDEFTNWQNGVTATANFLKNADPGMYSALQKLGQPGAGQADVQNFFNAAQNSGSFGASAGSRIQFMGNSAGNTTPVTSGTQTQVPGAPANTPAAQQAPADAAAGPASTESIQYSQGANAAAIPKPAGNDTWAQTEEYIRKNYPTYSWLLNIKGPDSPASVIQQAVTGGWDPTRLEAAIAQTHWWRTTSNALQQWEQNMATNPSMADFNAKGSAAQQALGAIVTAANAANWKPPEAVLKNLAIESLMYGWDPNDIQINVGNAAASGVGQSYGTGYLTGMEQNREQYAIAGFTKGATKTGAIAATNIQQVVDAIGQQGYNVNDFSKQQIDNMANQIAEFNLSPGQLAELVIKTGSGGNAGQLSQQWTQGMITDKSAWLFAGQDGQKYTGTNAASALTDVRDAIAASGRTIGSGQGQIRADQVQQLAQEYLMFNWKPEQLAANINNLDKKGGGLLDPGYLQGLITNSSSYQQGGEAYNAAHQAVIGQAAQSGVQLSRDAIDALTEEYMQRGWQSNPGELTTAIGQTKGAGGLTSAYLTGMQANPEQYNPGGSSYKAAQSAINLAARGYGKKLNPSDMPALIQQYLQQNWDEGSPGLEQAIGTAAGNSGYTSQYLTGMAGNSGQYLPGGTAYIQAENDVATAVRNSGVTGLTQDEMNTLIEGVMQQGWDQPTLANEIGALSHQKGAGAYNPQYLQGLAENWREYQFTTPGQNSGVQTIADQVLTQVEMVAGQQGVNLRPAQAQQIAKLAMESGGNNPADSLIQSLLGKYVTVAQGPDRQGANPIAVPANLDVTKAQGGLSAQGGTVGPVQGSPGLGAQTNAPALLQQLRTQATNYLINLPDSVYQQWAQQIAGGTQTIQSYEAYLAQQSAAKYPGMAEQIQQGQTPSQIAGGLTTLASNLLEIQPDQVNYLNPQFQKLLTGGYNMGPNNTQIPNNMMMTQTQAGDYLRRLPQFATTTNAKTDAANVETAILQAWGRVG